jgi:hypothetical protein
MKLPAFLFLFLSAATLSARADADALGGRWRGTFSSPSGDSVIELQFDQSAGIYRGHYWTTTPDGTSFTVDPAGAGQSIRFVVPNVGVFQGRLRGDVLEGTFTDADRAGTFRVNRAPEPDFAFID